MRLPVRAPLSPTRLARLLLLAALAGCAAEPGPNGPYAPVPDLSPDLTIETPRARLRGAQTGPDDVGLAGVRGLTFEEFHACMVQKAALKTEHQRLQAREPVIDGLEKLLEDEDQALERARAAIDPSDGRAVAGFNARIERQHAKLRDFNQQVNEFNGEIDKARTAQGVYSLNCTRRPFRTTDVERLPPELRGVASEDMEDFDLPAYFTDTPPAASASRAGAGDVSP